MGLDVEIAGTDQLDRHYVMLSYEHIPVRML
jgi:hypothetical protein